MTIKMIEEVTSLSDFTITGLNVYTETSVLANSGIRILKGKIAEIISNPESTNTQNIHSFPRNYHLIPGRIDMHIHGAAGADVMDANPKALDQIRQTLAQEGVTGFLATTLTETPKKIEAALRNIDNYQRNVTARPAGADILGVHLEGPFISPEHPGAHRRELLLNPDIKLFEHWQGCANGWIKLVTLAPELPGGIDFIRYLKHQQILASIGHTDADFQTTQKAIDAGATHATHLFNAMRSFHHREPGCLGAILLNDLISAELIVDSHHCHSAAVQIALKLKSKNNIVLVTDAMRGKCCDENQIFELGGQQVRVSQGAARLKNGVLAGSVLTMHEAIINMMKQTFVPLCEIIPMTSINPAKILGIYERTGSITKDKDADFVILDENLTVVVTVAKGQVIYTRQSH